MGGGDSFQCFYLCMKDCMVCTRASSVHGAFSMPGKPCSVSCNSDGKGNG